jgi:hypothetical protein
MTNYYNSVAQRLIHWSLVIGYWSLILFLPSPAQTTIDPLTLGMGARPLGMGRAFIAIAEDSDALFTNPAGLGEIDCFEFSTMSGTLLEELKYTTIGGIYPLGEKSAWGIGYISAGLTGIELRDLTGNLTGRTNFENNLYLLSYGRKVSDNLSFGLNIKYFAQNAHDQTEANGSGWNADLGLLQKGLGWLSIGLVVQNFASSSQLNYRNAAAASLPLTIKFGTKLALAGERFESAIIAPYELIIAADADLELSNIAPTNTHFGVEFSPNKHLTLRGGIDQIPTFPGAQNYFTGGVTLSLAGFGFHYAYHPFTDLGDNAAHFFSISFNEHDWPTELTPEFLLGQDCQKSVAMVK